MMKKRNALIGLTLLLSVMISCQRDHKTDKGLNGHWNSLGSGWILNIQDSTSYSFYDLTKISCLPARKGSLDEIMSSLRIENDTLVLRKGIVDYSFIRTAEMPELCSKDLDSAKVNDPLFNFEVFAQIVGEHYAFFDLNQLNWDSLYREQRNKLNPSSTDLDLYNVIDETLERLNDNHAYLEASPEVYDMMPSEEDSPEQENESLPEYGDFQVADLVVSNHLEEDMTQDSWLIKWGKLQEGMGYIQVKAMWLFADLKIDLELIEEVGYVDAYVQTFHQMYEGTYIQKEVKGVSQIMDRVMSDLEDMDAIVIDVRFNGGGQDAVSFEILNRFTSGSVQIATRKLRDGDNFTPVQTLSLSGNPNAFNKPVYVLTSPQTGSAAEAFSIATLDMEQIQRIGSPTAGALSTALEKTLPNGWVFSISNEIYMDNMGVAYENQGIPVNLDFNYSRDRQEFFRSVVNDLEKDKDDILKAITELESK